MDDVSAGSPPPDVKRALAATWRWGGGWPADSLVFTVMALWMCWPVPRFLSQRVLGDTRDSLLNLQQMDHVQRAILDGAWSDLLNAPIFHPHPDTLVWTEHLIGLSIATLPLRLFTSDATIIYNLVTILALALNGLCAAYLGRVLAGRWVGLACGIFYGMAPGRLAHIMHLQHELMFIPPLVLALLVRFHSEKRLWLLLSAAALLSWQVVMVPTHAVYLPFFIAIPALACIPALKTLHSRQWPVLLGALIPLGLMAWLSVEPYSALNELYGYKRSLQDALGHAATLKALVTVDGHHDVAGKWMRQPPWGSLEETLWIGGSLLVTSVMGAVLARYRGPLHPAHPAALLSCVAVLLFMCFVPHGSIKGVPFPGKWLWEHVHFLQLIRGFSRFYLFMLVALTALAALGLREFHQRRPRAGTWVGATLVVWCLVELLPGSARSGVLEHDGKMHPIYTMVQASGQNGPYMELPYRLHGSAALHNYSTTKHHGRTTNGYSGFYYALPISIRWLVNTLPLEPALSVVRRLGVRNLLLFSGGNRAAPDDTFPTLEQAYTNKQLPPGITLLATTKDAVAFSLEPLEPGPWTFQMLTPGTLTVPRSLPTGGIPITGALYIPVDGTPRPNITPRQRATVQLVHEGGTVYSHPTFLEAPPILWSERVPISFTFTGPPASGAYHVTLLDQDGRVLGETRVEASPVVPHSARERTSVRARLEADLPQRMRPDHTVVLHARITNTGKDLWIANAGITEHPRRFDVRVGYRWPADAQPQPELRMDLPHDVEPGQSVDMDIPLRAPKKPGTYVVKLDLLRQLMAWFESEGSTPLQQEVVVQEEDPT